MTMYDVEVQWGGADAPWRRDGAWAMGSGDAPLRRIELSSDDRGDTLTGVASYADGREARVRAERAEGGAYAVEETPPARGADASERWVLGGRDAQWIVSLRASSGGDAGDLVGICTYAGEGPIDLRARARAPAQAPPRPPGDAPQEPAPPPGAPAAPGRKVGRHRGAGNDAVGRVDQLGFSAYGQAFADLIESPSTKMPLTIGVFGSWGVGKSFLLKHIIGELEVRGERRRAMAGARRAPRVHVVEFNAWEYSATPVVWPGLVRRIMERMEECVDWGFPGGHIVAKARYQAGRFLRPRLRLTAALAALVGAAAAFAVWRYGFAWRSLHTALTGLGVTGAVTFVSQALSRPLGQRITSLFQGPDYGRYSDHMAATRDDLQFLSDRLAPTGDRILVIIDDLDRCEPQKAIEVFQAINLLLNFDNLIVCLGVDARIITRAIERHYSNLLGPAGVSGYEYLDKIIQIPFRIPTPGSRELATFIDRLLDEPGDAHVGGPPPPSPRAADAAREPPPPAAQPAAGASPAAAAPAGATEEARAFTADERDAFRAVVPFLRRNPRHVKRLLNVYRVVRTLADYQGERLLLDEPGATTRWLVMCGQWPYTTHAMLWYLDEMLERVDDGRLAALPDEAPLPYLLARVEGQLTPEKRRRIDHDPDLLRALLRGFGDGLDWAKVQTLRRYTLNFNPAIEVELTLEQEIRLAPEDGGPPR